MSTDAHDLYKLTARLENIAFQIEALAPELAAAKQVDRYDSDRKKNLLAEFMAPLLVGNSATAAETLARANVEFRKRLKDLSQELLSALGVIAKESALQAQLEAVRSILSSVKAQMSL